MRNKRGENFEGVLKLILKLYSSKNRGNNVFFFKTKEGNKLTLRIFKETPPDRYPKVYVVESKDLFPLNLSQLRKILLSLGIEEGNPKLRGALIKE